MGEVVTSDSAPLVHGQIVDPAGANLQVTENPEDLRVAACVVHWGQSSLTDRCLRSIAASNPELPLLVIVNDGSGYRPPAPLVAACIDSKRNLGFAEGMTVGLQWAAKGGHDLVLLSTNDVWYTVGAINGMIKNMRRHERAAACSPAVCRRREDREETFLWALFGTIDWNAGTAALGVGTVPADVDWLPGSAWMVRVAAAEQVGGFDARFFMYWEEVDWCVRARRHGWELLVCPDATVMEESSASAGTIPCFQSYYLARNRLLFLAKNSRRLALMRALSQTLRTAALEIGGNGPLRPHAWALIDFLFGRYGLRRDLGARPDRPGA